MPVRQKTFRIEQKTSGDGAPSIAPTGAASGLQYHDVLGELKALRDLIEQRTPAPPHIENDCESEDDQITAGDLNTLKNETDAIHRVVSHTMQEFANLHFGAFGDTGHGRARRELDAVVDSSQQATQQILEAAEAIDEAANTLSASLKNGQDQALTSDVRDQVVRIFEACNFQDLGGQRIAKVVATLTFVEDRIARMLDIWGGRDALMKSAAVAPAAPDSPAKMVSGPKLSGDPGHISQQEIDAMFD
jgi:chemotaxis protein CheZ